MSKLDDTIGRLEPVPKENLDPEAIKKETAEIVPHLQELGLLFARAFRSAKEERDVYGEDRIPQDYLNEIQDAQTALSKVERMARKIGGRQTYAEGQGSLER